MLEAAAPGAVAVPAVRSTQRTFTSADGTTIRMFVLAPRSGPRAAAHAGHRLRRLRHLPRARLQRGRAGLGRGGRLSTRWSRCAAAARRATPGTARATATTSRTSSTTSTPPRGARRRGHHHRRPAGDHGRVQRRAARRRGAHPAARRVPGRRLLGAAAGHGPLRASSRSAAPGTTSTARRPTPTSSAGCSSYSPYHHVGTGTVYPAVLFTVFESDTRVDPLHARKMCAALQHATTGELATRPVLLRRETDVGHGARSVTPHASRSPSTSWRSSPHTPGCPVKLPIPLTTTLIPRPSRDRPPIPPRRWATSPPPSEPVCATDPGSWCDQIYRWTDNDFLARSADAIVGQVVHDRPHPRARADRPLAAAPGDQPARRGATSSRVSRSSAAGRGRSSARAPPRPSRPRRAQRARTHRLGAALGLLGRRRRHRRDHDAGGVRRGARPDPGLGGHRRHRGRLRRAEPRPGLPLRHVHAAGGPVRRGRHRRPGQASGTVEAVGLRITTVARRQRHRLVRPQRRDPAGGQQEPGLRRRRGGRAAGAQHRRRAGHRDRDPGRRRGRGGARRSPSTCWRSPRSSASRRSARRA